MRHRRVIVTRYGGPDALRVIEEECPEPKAGEVRGRVLAAGIFLPDLLMREGVHPETRPVALTPRRDLIDAVDRLGPGGVTRKIVLVRDGCVLDPSGTRKARVA